MERIPSRVEGLLSKIRESFAVELEDRYSTPGSWDDVNPLHIEMIRRGEKIPRAKDKRELLMRIAQDYRLTPEEVDFLELQIFEL